jgi:hypothetical protein
MGTLIVIGAGMTVVFVLIMRNRSRTMTQTIPDASGDQPQLTMIGAGTWVYFSFFPVGASTPFVRVDLFRWGMRIGPRWRWLPVPTWDIPWSDIRYVSRTITGIRVWRNGAEGWVTFKRLSGVPPSLFVRLREYGVIVNDPKSP